MISMEQQTKYRVVGAIAIGLIGLYFFGIWGAILGAAVGFAIGDQAYKKGWL